MSWLEPVLDPWPLITQGRQSESDDPRIGLALLLQAQFRLYREHAQRVRWPAIGEPAPPRADLGRRLLGAIGLHFVGDRRAPAEYRRVLRSRDSALRAVGAISASIYYRDSGAQREQFEVLRAALRREKEAAQRALLWIHLGIRAAEEGTWTDAVSASRNALSEVEKDVPALWLNEIQWIAAHNLFQFRWRESGPRMDPSDLPLRPSVPALLRADVLQVAPLAAFLDEQFDAVFADPNVHSVVLAAEDLPETQLQGALIGADWLGDWQEVAQTRRLLGRYQLLAARRSRQPASSASLELLRQADDEKGLRTAARAMARGGPLAALQQAVSQLVATWRVLGVPNASLVLLSEGADSMVTEDAAKAVTKLIADPPFFVGAWAEASRALAALVKVSPNAQQAGVAQFTMELLQQHSQHAGLVQSLQEVVGSINWPAVDASVRRVWLDYAEHEFRSGTGTRLVAGRVLRALADLEPDEVMRFVVNESQRETDISSIAVALAIMPRLPFALRAPSFDVVEGALGAIREQAAAGSWGLGGFDVGAMAVLLLDQWPGYADGWNALLGFLLDPLVSVSAKAGALRLLSNQSLRIPRHVSSVLKEALPTLEGFADAFSPFEQFEAARFRLGLRLRAFRREENIARLVDMSAGSVSARIEAAHALRGAGSRVGREFVVAMALTLANDEHHEVRAAAGYALSGIKLRPRDDALTAMIGSRLHELLAEQGGLIPLAVLSGLADADGSMDLKGFRAQVEQIRKAHPSHAVRRAAADVASRLQAAMS